MSRRPSIALGQGQPQLKQAHLASCRDVLAVDDPAAGRHPLHLSRLDHAAFIAIVDRSVEDERHGFEAGVRMRAAHRAVADVEMIIGEHDERIVENEVLGRHDLRRKVAGTDKSRGKRRNGDDACDTTLLRHDDLRDECESATSLGTITRPLPFAATEPVAAGRVGLLRRSDRPRTPLCPRIRRSPRARAARRVTARLGP